VSAVRPYRRFDHSPPVAVHDVQQGFRQASLVISSSGELSVSVELVSPVSLLMSEAWGCLHSGRSRHTPGNLKRSRGTTTCHRPRSGRRNLSRPMSSILRHYRSELAMRSVA
jgi:hypothetical protein